VGQSIADEIGTRVKSQLLEDMGAVRLHRLHADAELIGDLLVAVPAYDPLENFLLPLAQEIELLRSGRRPTGSRLRIRPNGPGERRVDLRLPAMDGP